jgi:rhomboid protease GluP
MSVTSTPVAPSVNARGSFSATSLNELMRSPARQAPVTTALLVINLLVFAAMLMFGAGLWHTSNNLQLAWGANFGPATQDGQWWRLFTAMFIHFGIVHLGLNMWALWDVGRLVERLYGRLNFFVLYLASGVLGNLLSLVVQGNRAVSGGASGAVFSLYGALLVFLWRERKQVERGEFRWLFGAASVFTLLTLGMGLVVPGIDNAAHVGGLLSGALLGSVMARRWTVGSPDVITGRWLAGALLLAGTVALMQRIPEPIYRFGEELRAQEAIRAFLTEDQRISQKWDAILDSGRRNQATFDQLAGSIDTNVTAVYQHSFEQLMAASPGGAAPSARTLATLQSYANLRADASRELAEGLRNKDVNKIRSALEQAKQAPARAQAEQNPARAQAQQSPASAAQLPKPATEPASSAPTPSN